ncbi:hypothetical protein RFI_12615 [Reticulomyxa filosa]|uniref:Uncharacterized protein n=1 Tax=Reticulomyxa filosa TaxID=46433 RepID=X6NDY9_RETFI|nr:hypothetical protein RFI_12615 [Reticulomyxa filosa]|eukprot:ETO24540.1 hypothetical protein RFI_12615 [Reticulomyxa filosa]
MHSDVELDSQDLSSLLDIGVNNDNIYIKNKVQAVDENKIEYSTATQNDNIDTNAKLDNKKILKQLLIKNQKLVSFGKFDIGQIINSEMKIELKTAIKQIKQKQ